MKKALFLLILAGIVSILPAIVGFGFYGGKDLLTVDQLNETEFELNIGSARYEYTLARDEVSMPTMFGGYLNVDLPVFPIAIEGSFTAAYAAYSWRSISTLTNTETGEEINIDLGYDLDGGNYDEEFAYWRLSADITGKWYFLQFPPVLHTLKVYAGAGFGMNFISPLVSKELFIEELKDAEVVSDQVYMDMEDIVAKATAFGGHIVVGAKVKPPVIPLAFTLDYKHKFTAENDYGDPTNSFGTIRLGVGLEF